MSPWSDPWAERPWKGLLDLVLEEAGVYPDASGIVHVPYRRQDGSLFREHLFARSGRSWWGPGDRLLPLGVETLPEPDADHTDLALILAEGDSDALAIREAFAGVTADNPIRGYFVLGLPGASSWQKHWREYVDRFDLVYVIGDGDDAGRRLIKKILVDVPWARPVRLPEGADARSLLQEKGADALDAHLEAADREYDRLAGAALLYHVFRAAASLADCERLLRAVTHPRKQEAA